MNAQQAAGFVRQAVESIRAPYADHARMQAMLSAVDGWIQRPDPKSKPSGFIAQLQQICHEGVVGDMRSILTVQTALTVLDGYEGEENKEERTI